MSSTAVATNNGSMRSSSLDIGSTEAARIPSVARAAGVRTDGSSTDPAVRAKLRSSETGLLAVR